ncbi:MAG: DUF2029 domain-containing protein [Elusimicrobia bacterium]|nr:DUF2029 domain-containing protein [Elusimicrobiota bacterium]
MSPRWPAHGTMLALLVAATGAFHAATLRAGHDWGDDFAMYIRLASNIAEGRPYLDTPFRANPQTPPNGVHAVYPPGFPLLLAPAYRAFGMDLARLKLAGLALFLLALVFLDGWLATAGLPGPWRLALVATVAFNPYYWELKDQVLSDLPFLACVFAALWFHGRRDILEGTPLRRGALLGVLLYAAYAVRPVGLLLALAVVVEELIRNRRLRPPVALAAGVFGLAVIAQGAWLAGPLGGEGGRWTAELGFLLDQYRNPAEAARLWLNHAYDLVKAAAYYWDTGRNPVLSMGLVLAFGAFAAAGFWLRAREGADAAAIFFVLSVLMLCSYPTRGLSPGLAQPRYMVTLFPLFLVYAAYAVRAVPEAPARALAGWSLAAALASGYAVRYGSSSFGPIPWGVGTPATAALFERVKAADPRNVYVFTKPRALALFTGRAAATYAWNRPDEDHWRFFGSIGATHVVWSRDFWNDQTYLRPFLQRNAPRLAAEFVSPEFEIYRIR